LNEPLSEDQPVRTADLLKMSLAALYQQKVRTILTMIGVVIGSFVLVVSLSVGTGVKDAAMREFRRHDELRRIMVYPGYGGEAGIPPEEIAVKGDVSDAKRERLRQALIDHWYRKNSRRPKVQLDREKLNELAALDHVKYVYPMFHVNARVYFGSQGEDVFSAGAVPENRHFQRRLVAGSFFTAADERAIVVTEYLLYRWGFASEEEVNAAVGRKVRLEFHSGRQAPLLLLSLFNAGTDNLSLDETRVLEKATKQLPSVLDALKLEPEERDLLEKALKRPTKKPQSARDVTIVEEFTIAGVLREVTKEDQDASLPGDWWSRNAEVVLPAKTAAGVLYQMPYVEENGVNTAIIDVDSEDHVREVLDQVTALGLTKFSLVEFMEKVRMNLTLLTFATGFVAAVALLVAALGITNTMVMSVLERTHEIGVMKAVGARDGHVQLIFLVEGALIGAIGGGLGLLGSWLASFPGDRIAAALMEKQGEIKVEGSLFVFPLWLTLGVPLFASLVTTLAAVYPARKAARVNPIAALRHE
jgi:putative ABC transport system permease protein